MAKQDLVPKTRFEKQIPFPILYVIAVDVATLDTNYPLDETDKETQLDTIHALAESLHDENLLKISEREKLIAIAAEAIRTIKLIDKQK